MIGWGMGKEKIGHTEWYTYRPVCIYIDITANEDVPYNAIHLLFTNTHDRERMH